MSLEAHCYRRPAYGMRSPLRPGVMKSYNSALLFGVLFSAFLLVAAGAAKANPECEREYDPIFSDDFEYSDNWLVSTVQATTVTSVDASLNATSQATTESIFGAGSQRTSSSTNCFHAATKFVSYNRMAILRDIAVGHGEHIASLSVLLGVKDRNEFIAHSRTKLSVLTSNSAISPRMFVSILRST